MLTYGPVRFFRRLFSADLRSAIAAEANGDLASAAEHYALAEEFESAVRIHFVRADRAETRSEEIEALQEALHWSPEGSDLKRRATRRLGRALLAKVEAEVVTTDRDRARVREAAEFLEAAGDHKAAGDAYDSIGDNQRAARAYRSGGHVEELEAAIAEGEQLSQKQSALHSAFADYRVSLNGGQRTQAIASLRQCVEIAENKAEYQRLLDELTTRQLSNGRIELRIRKGPQVVVSSAPTVIIGRDPTADFQLRSQGISRRHLEIQQQGGNLKATDAGSRNGVLLNGLPLEPDQRLPKEGTLSLGDDCELTFSKVKTAMSFTVSTGIDQKSRLYLEAQGADVDLTNAGFPCSIYFKKGCPFLRHPQKTIYFQGNPIERGDLELISGDVVKIENVEVDVG